jgi:hypothetical protein
MVTTQTDSDGHDPWEISDSDYPAQGTAGEKLRFLLGYAALAPSRSNTQPWEFLLRDGMIELHADDARRREVVDPRGREAVMSCGAALYYLRLAMRVFGHDAVVEMPASPDQPLLLARVRLGAAVTPTEDDQALFHAIRSRRTFRGRFRPQDLAPEMLRALGRAADQEACRLVFLQSAAERRAVAELVADGDEALRDNPDFWREEAETTAPGDGRPALAEFLTSFFWPVSGLLQTPFILGKDRRLVIDAPAVAVLATEGDRTEDWLRAGQALAAVLLRADTFRVEASFLSQPMEVLRLRPGLQALVGGSVPQLILRLGFTDGKYLPHSPRRPVDESLRFDDRAGASGDGT